MARYVSPEQYVRTLRTAARVARNKGMIAESVEATRLANEYEAKIKQTV